jgi:hypothetical protein
MNLSLQKTQWVQITASLCQCPSIRCIKWYQFASPWGALAALEMFGETYLIRPKQLINNDKV